MKRYGGIFISDEVQTGWGRTGGRWFGIEQYDVVPDVMTAAKGIANGLPLGLTVARPEGGGFDAVSYAVDFRRQPRCPPSRRRP